VKLNDKEYDEEFIFKAAVIAHARSRSLNEVAASLCVPPESLENRKEYYAKKIKIQYLPNKYIQHNKRADKEVVEKCPGCGSRAVFEPIKSFPVQQAQNTEFIVQQGGGYDTGAYLIDSPVVDVTTEYIERCPKCGLYTIQYITERLPNSEV